MDNENASTSSVVIKQKERFGFIDQFRGIVIFLFVIADITWTWSGNPALGVVPVGPTWMNHGWKFFAFDDKQIITLIDVGQLLFVFVMGLMIPLSWKRHVQKGGPGNAIGQLLVRLGWFYLIAGVMGDFAWRSTFFTNTFAILAAAMLFASIAAALVKDPKHRQYLNLGLLATLGVLYAIPGLKEASESVFGNYSSIAIIPLNLLGATTVAIQAGIFMEWFVAAGEDKKPAIKQILNVSALACIACFLIDYLYWADHHAMNVAMSLMALGVGGFLFTIFWFLGEHLDWRVPGLNPFGRNTLLAFILALPFQMLVWDVLDLAGTFKTSPWPLAPAMALVSAVIMFALYYVVLVPLDRKQWFFTPSIFIRAFQRRSR